MRRKLTEMTHREFDVVIAKLSTPGFILKPPISKDEKVFDRRFRAIASLFVHDRSAYETLMKDDWDKLFVFVDGDQYEFTLVRVTK